MMIHIGKKAPHHKVQISSELLRLTEVAALAVTCASKDQ